MLGGTPGFEGIHLQVTVHVKKHPVVFYLQVGPVGRPDRDGPHHPMLHRVQCRASVLAYSIIVQYGALQCCSSASNRRPGRGSNREIPYRSTTRLG